jgi:Rha family phage regulatory protein
MSTETPIVDFNSFVFADGEMLKTTSLIVAEKFKKSHAHVLRDIEVLLTQVSDSFNKTNFGFIEIDVKVGFGTRKDKVCELTRDGLTILVMGYTGEVAMAIKETYINAFNFMHKKLFEKPEKPFFKPQPMTTPLHPTMMTRQMKTHVQHMIDVSVHEKNQTTNKVVMDLARFFYCDTWELIPMKYYPDVCAYFEVPAIYKVQSTNNWIMIEESKLGQLNPDSINQNRNAIITICNALDIVDSALDTLASNA